MFWKKLQSLESAFLWNPKYVRAFCNCRSLQCYMHLDVSKKCVVKGWKRKILVPESVGANKSRSRDLINSQETHLYVTASEGNWILFFMWCNLVLFLLVSRDKLYLTCFHKLRPQQKFIHDLSFCIAAIKCRGAFHVRLVITCGKLNLSGKLWAKSIHIRRWDSLIT